VEGSPLPFWELRPGFWILYICGLRVPRQLEGETHEFPLRRRHLADRQTQAGLPFRIWLTRHACSWIGQRL